jgi:exonuclease III
MIDSESETNWPIYNNLEDVPRELNTLNKKLSFVCLNVRSLRNKFDLLKVILDKCSKKFNFIVLTEVWIGSNEVNFFNIEGYCLFSKCNDTYAAGGVLIYIDETISKVKIKDYNMKTADVLFINIQVGNLLFTLGAVYRLHKYSKIEFLKEFEVYIKDCNCNCIIMGDFNINTLVNDTDSKEFCNLLRNYSFEALINQCTREGLNSESCIDNVLVRYRNLELFDIKIVKLGLTDHFMILLDFQYMRPIPTVPATSVMKKHINYNNLIKELESESWESVYSCHDVDMCLSYFYDILNNSINNNSEVKKVSSKFVKAKQKSPWINNKILNKIKKRNKLFKLSSLRPYDVNLKKYFSNFQQKLSDEINECKNKYYETLIDKFQGNTREQWRIVNSLTGATDKVTVDKIELDSGTVIEDPMVICERVNEYFVNIQSLLSSVSQNPCSETNNLNIAESMFVLATNEMEINNCILSLKNKKSCGIDGLSVELIKIIAPYISHVLSYIFNLSFRTGKFPTQFKKSIVIPLLKKPNSFKLDNLRPISLLPTLAKLLEKLMKKRLISFLDKYKCISDKQFGFIKGKSTEDALSVFVGRIYNSINLSQKTTAIFIDFRKAFDMVSHKILLDKLFNMGIRGISADWFYSYLSGREQVVKIKTTVSKAMKIKKGVPQGAILSANLFLIFINSLLELPFKGKICAFADDVAFLYSNSSYSEIHDNIAYDLSLLAIWCKNNEMVINVSKTKFINFDLRGLEFPYNIIYHEPRCEVNSICKCEEVEGVNNFKYLGIILDNKLNWRPHIDYLHRSISFNIRKFYFLRSKCNPQLMKSLYFALIHSRLVYGIHCWGGSFKFLINKLRKTQNQFIRLILFKQKRESSFPLYKSLKILPIQHLFIYKVLRNFFNRSGNLGLDQYFDSNYTTRSVSERFFKRPKVYKFCFQKSFLFLGPKCFNLLPSQIKLCNNVKKFCKALETWLLNLEDLTDFTSILS